MLIGTSSYESGELPDLPAVRNNVKDLANELSAFPADRRIVIPEPTDLRAVYRALRRYGAVAEDTFLVYFAGHGRTGRRNELYLGLTGTDPDELEVSSLPYDLLRNVLLESSAKNRIVMLDCCFSGRATEDMAGGEATLVGQMDIEGTYVLASTPANAVALAPRGERYTAFTGELIELLRAGVGGEEDLLTFGFIYQHLRERMIGRGLPRPCQRGTGNVDRLALARNRRAEASAQPIRPPPEARTRWGAGKPITASLRMESAMGWLFLAAGLAYGLVQLAVLGVAVATKGGSAEFTDLWVGAPEHLARVWWDDLLLLPVTMVLGVVVWRRTRSGPATPRVIGIVAGFGLPWVIAAPLHLENALAEVGTWPLSDAFGSGSASRAWLSGTVTAGYLGLISATVLGAIAAARLRTKSRPGYQPDAWAVIVLACVAAASYLVDTYSFGWGYIWTAHLYYVGLAMVTIALAVVAVRSGPAGLAEGLLGGWLAFGVPTAVSALCWGLTFAAMPDAHGIAPLVFATATAGMLVAFGMRIKRHRNGPIVSV
ncbi:caspase family protein [Actinoplanes sp. CA-030573]|uniref:caspase family protein n=1 Tax=Actinoplanes sp. CA-030573 TaxID=3239898 RepID=UPI003D924486